MRTLLNKLTAYLIRRDPRRSLAASAYFLAHDTIIEVAKHDLQGATQEQVYEAGEDLAERILDVANCEMDGAFLILERLVLHANFDADAHDYKCDAQLSENPLDCTCDEGD